jgi:rhamnulokinase
VQSGNQMHWPLDRILAGVTEGLCKAAAAAPEGIRSIAVDGWAVDYVRLPAPNQPIAPPRCYRDERTLASKALADAIVPPEEFFSTTGVQPSRINTAYQLVADRLSSAASEANWLLLPEYVLHWLGGRRVAEYTNATHTGLVDIHTGGWSAPLFERLGLDLQAAPPIVPAGTSLGKLTGPLTAQPAFADTELLTAACHDTASAIAAIPASLTHSAYIVSGTWSLVGTLLERPITSPEAQQAGFTNLGAASGGYCFHSNVNGMWLLKQCLNHWDLRPKTPATQLNLAALIDQAARVAEIPGLIDVDAPSLLLAGEMPARINRELQQRGHAAIPDQPGNEPIFARVIFASLAARYATVLRNLESLTGQRFQQLVLLGGGSRNSLLTRLTEQSTGLPILLGEVEGSTLGNFAVQLATHSAREADSSPQANQQLSQQQAIQQWASQLATTLPVSA